MARTKLPGELGQEGGIIAGGQETASADERFVSAHRALKGDSTIQFDLTRPDPPPTPPSWLKDMLDWLGDLLEPVARFFAWLTGLMPDAPYARILLWTMIALLAAALLWLAWQRLRHGQWVLRKRFADLAPQVDEEEWAPDHAPARRWLEEADALAAQGRYAEAVHHLLFRSVEDIARRRPALVQPAVTSRELAAAEAVPANARSLFARIAVLVERSLFGGRPLGPTEWSAARQDYADFALAKAWKA